jgi:2-succinyl-6-hydroxy-2,4-cyclohexadiene-1-carboxylate synthase
VAWDAAVGLVAGWIGEAGPGVTLVGYSMGGRIALAAALEYPEGLDRLVLVSASPGMADEAARERRLSEDEATADCIERLGVDLFLAEWLSRPMFSGLGRRSAAWGSRDLRLRQSNEAAGLAGAVRLLGHGSQPYLGEGIAGLEIPLVTVAGDRDEAYVSHGQRMAGVAPEGRFIEVSGTGHAVVGEDPASVMKALSDSLGDDPL